MNNLLREEGGGYFFQKTRRESLCKRVGGHGEVGKGDYSQRDRPRFNPGSVSVERGQ